MSGQDSSEVHYRLKRPGQKVIAATNIDRLCLPQKNERKNQAGPEKFTVKVSTEQVLLNGTGKNEDLKKQFTD